MIVVNDCTPPEQACTMAVLLQDGRVDSVKPVLLTELYGWACWRFNLEVKVQQQEQQVFYTINMDPFGHRSASCYIT